MRSLQLDNNRNSNNGEAPASASQFQSTISLQKLRKLNVLILALRFATPCFSFASAVFMLTNSRLSNSPHWYGYDAFRFAMAANLIVAVYSLFETGAAVWEISETATFLPETVQVWFDFGHDQVFPYLVLSATAAGTELARRLRETGTCGAGANANAFCLQSDIAIALGFAGFVFLGFSSLLSGFRLVSFLTNGSRFHL